MENWNPKALAGFGETLDEFVAEGRDVFWFAARDQIAVPYDILVHPVGSSVFEIGADGGPGGDGFCP
jgi:hypothetical protein